MSAGLVHATAVSGATGNWVYGGLWNSTGLVRLELNDTGDLTSATALGGTLDEDVVALAQATLGQGAFLFSARLTDAAVTSWEIGASGDLVETASLGMANGLGIATPTALEITEFAGETFLVLASAGSSSISVIAVAADGSLDIRDHIVDDLNTRFAGTQAMASVSHDGSSYLVAGGGDDGISLFQMIPGGRLIHLQTIADTDGMSLNNVSALEAVALGTEIQVFASSGIERGITQFSFIPDPAGIIDTTASSATQTTANADILQGGRGGVQLDGQLGNDILIDGTGVDTLTGGGGEDIFVLVPDLSTDTILDFELGVDRIDLSAFPMLRSIDQLEFISTSTGARLKYQGETLEIRTIDGTSLAAGDFATTDFISQSRAVPLGGFATGLHLTGTDASDDIFGGIGADSLVGASGDDLIKGGNGADKIWGGSGADRLFGGAIKDQIYGGNGNDTIWGEAGNDEIWGGAQHDVIYGNNGWDRLIGGLGNDRIYGGSGNDQLWGWNGYDVLN